MSAPWITQFTKWLGKDKAIILPRDFLKPSEHVFPLCKEVHLLNAVIRVFLYVLFLTKSFKCTNSQLLFINYK